MKTTLRLTIAALGLATFNISAATLYVSQESTNPVTPFTNWTTAARGIQDAVDAAAAGDEIVVTNGIFATGGRVVGTNLLFNRVAVDKPVTVRSVNGPEFTVIQGYQLPGTTNGDGAIRCVYLADGATLSGFTLTNGATRCAGGEILEQSGGGLWCEAYGPFATNCILTGNSACYEGGGVSVGTLTHCTLTGNSAAVGGGASGTIMDNSTLTGNSAYEGGAVYGATLIRCTLARNSAHYGGAVSEGTLDQCLLVGNSAYKGGGAAWAGLYGCTLTANSAESSGGGAYNTAIKNCVLYYNMAPEGVNYDAFSTLNYSCTTPQPTRGFDNITNAPLFVDYSGGNLRLQSNSPCINAGKEVYVTGTTDLDGNPRIVSGTVDMGAYEYQGGGSVISYAWLQQYGLPTDGSADFTDSDSDGLNTWQEWRCGTCPTNTLSALRLLSAQSSSTDVTISWQSVAEVNYFLERSTNLSATPAFMPLATNMIGQPGTTSYADTNATGAGPCCYRVGVAN